MQVTPPCAHNENDSSIASNLGDRTTTSYESDFDIDHGADAAMAPPTPYRRSVSKERLSGLYSALKTQVYNDPAARGPGSAYVSNNHPFIL